MDLYGKNRKVTSGRYCLSFLVVFLLIAIAIPPFPAPTAAFDFGGFGGEDDGAGDNAVDDTSCDGCDGDGGIDGSDGTDSTGGDTGGDDFSNDTDVGVDAAADGFSGTDNDSNNAGDSRGSNNSDTDANESGNFGTDPGADIGATVDDTTPEAPNDPFGVGDPNDAEADGNKGNNDFSGDPTGPAAPEDSVPDDAVTDAFTAPEDQTTFTDFDALAQEFNERAEENRTNQTFNEDLGIQFNEQAVPDAYQATKEEQEEAFQTHQTHQTNEQQQRAADEAALTQALQPEAVAARHAAKTINEDVIDFTIARNEVAITALEAKINKAVDPIAALSIEQKITPLQEENRFYTKALTTKVAIESKVFAEDTKKTYEETLARAVATFERAKMSREITDVEREQITVVANRAVIDVARDVVGVFRSEKADDVTNNTREAQLSLTKTEETLDDAVKSYTREGAYQEHARARTDPTYVSRTAVRATIETTKEQRTVAEKRGEAREVAALTATIAAYEKALTSYTAVQTATHKHAEENRAAYTKAIAALDRISNTNAAKQTTSSGRTVQEAVASNVHSALSQISETANIARFTALDVDDLNAMRAYSLDATKRAEVTTRAVSINLGEIKADNFDGLVGMVSDEKATDAKAVPVSPEVAALVGTEKEAIDKAVEARNEVERAAREAKRARTNLGKTLSLVGDFALAKAAQKAEEARAIEAEAALARATAQFAFHAAQAARARATINSRLGIGKNSTFDGRAISENIEDEREDITFEEAVRSYENRQETYQAPEQAVPNYAEEIADLSVVEATTYRASQFANEAADRASREAALGNFERADDAIHEAMAHVEMGAISIQSSQTVSDANISAINDISEAFSSVFGLGPADSINSSFGLEAMGGEVGSSDGTGPESPGNCGAC